MSITLDKIGKTIGSRILFDDVCVSFNPGNRYGLTGPNGAGKSTLLKIITGEIEPTKGTVTLPKKVGILKQNLESFQNYTLIESVIMGNERLWRALEEKDRLYQEEFDDEKGMRLAQLEDIIAEENGYFSDSEAESLLNQIGIGTEFHNKKMSLVPSDFQFKALVCQALFGTPQALLLDEPTNHLDFYSISWLETFLKNYEGTVIVVSHDRHFLNEITTHIADIDYDTIIVYPSNYDGMIEMKTSVRERQLADIRSKEKKITQLKEFVSKFGAGTRSSQVKSRIKEINKLQPQDLKKSNIQRPYIRFSKSSQSSGKTVCSLENISKNYGDNKVLNNLCFEIYQGDKIGVIGNNGLGKTTLLKVLSGMEQPSSGAVKMGHQVLFSYLPQNHSDILKDDKENTLFDWLRNRKGGITDQDIRSVLGKMLFEGGDAFKKISSLSGGETVRLLLAGIMLEDHNFLILDEPNNHLDLEAVSALSWAIQDYQGTVIVVSHDRSLIENSVNRIISFEKNTVLITNDSLNEFLSKK